MKRRVYIHSWQPTYVKHRFHRPAKVSYPTIAPSNINTQENDNDDPNSPFHHG